MNNCTATQLIKFEEKIRDIFAAGELPFLIHLGGGNEKELIRIFEHVKDGDWVLASHRNHYHYLLAGGDPDRLEALIRQGDSMFVYDKKLNFLTSAILGGTCGIAAGIALAIKEAGGSERVWCFLGDGAADNGHLYEAAMLVEARKLPCMFIIEDNDRSVDTTKHERRGINSTYPWENFECVDMYSYAPTFPHGGAGLKTMVEFKKEAIEAYRKENP